MRRSRSEDLKLRTTTLLSLGMLNDGELAFQLCSLKLLATATSTVALKPLGIRCSRTNRIVQLSKPWPPVNYGALETFTPFGYPVRVLPREPTDSPTYRSKHSDPARNTEQSVAEGSRAVEVT